MTMAVQKQFVDKLKYPYSNCNFDVRLDEIESKFALKLKRLNQTYKQDLCFEVGKSDESQKIFAKLQ